MSSEKNPAMEEMEYVDILELEDEEGNTRPFELLDTVEYNGAQYAILIPEEDAEDEENEVTILQIEELEGGYDNFLSVEDEDVVDAVFALFKEKNEDNFNFA